MSTYTYRMVIAQIEDLVKAKFNGLEQDSRIVVRDDRVDVDVSEWYGIVFRTENINGDRSLGVNVCIQTILDYRFVEFASNREAPIDRVVRIFTDRDDEVTTRKKLEDEYSKLMLEMHERLHDICHNMYKVIKNV